MAMAPDTKVPGNNLPTDFQLLNDRGVLNQVSELQARLKDDEALLDDATVVFHLREVGEITDFVAEKLLNRFVPSYLTFVLEDAVASDAPGRRFQSLRIYGG